MKSACLEKHVADVLELNKYVQKFIKQEKKNFFLSLSLT